ncbi:sensor domain-containing diguanylate cyclase [Pseudomonas sp. LJDD11]|uniref:sensor domain-containing diguanylate cyclase n=1 Tax=unclassified Pseudomonas TaxID=196821 RepID=UPI0005ED6821|nr:sensor domain-containing diguanylate cyclase [Pseudomonas sp. StFLB209]MCO8160928.1 sensor domain-containing diguanylate cyclase [Pseudomonas sp. 21LCFQ010]MCQ9423333.1 sensor domain-containing diguanylate cyclase [Pseudomonas sp. LJDD11]
MKRDLHLAVVLLCVVCFALTFITGWKVFTARKAALNNVYVNGANLAQALITYSDGVVRQSSMLLNGLVERLEAEGFGEHQLDRLDKLLHAQQRVMPQLNGLTIYDRQGNWLLSSTGLHAQGLNSADRAYFIHHQRSASSEIFIGPPIQNRSTDVWVITISRRVNDSQGQFAGVVAATLGIKNFLDLFGKIDVGDNGTISLAFTHGQLLVRYPFREEEMGRDFSQSPIYKKYFMGRSSGNATFTSSLDGVERISTFRQSDTLPLLVSVAREKSEVLRNWRFEALLSLAVLAVLIVFVVAAGLVLLRHIKRRIESESELLIARQQLLSSNEKLEQLALQDPLTGLANRRCFDERLLMESSRAQRNGTTLGLLLVDIDFFKRFNDSLGHVAGDQCLQAVGQTIGGCVRRATDLAARYGGEELALILPDTDSQGVSEVAALILQRLEALSIPHPASPYGRVSVSIGMACFNGQQLADGSIVEAADEALYRAKAQGRNRLEA